MDISTFKNFDLLQINVVNEVLHHIPSVEPDVNIDSLDLSLGYDVKIGDQIDILDVFIHVTYSLPDGRTVAHYDLLYTFRCETEDAILKEPNSIKIKTSRLITFISIAFSTTRGYIAAKASNTLGARVLPIIDPIKFTKSHSNIKDEWYEIHNKLDPNNVRSEEE